MMIMVVIAICPFCLQETRENIVKTESVNRDIEGTDSGCNDLVYLRCEDCDKVWIEFRHVSDKS
jgi:hypothetical protein